MKWPIPDKPGQAPLQLEIPKSAKAKQPAPVFDAKSSGYLVVDNVSSRVKAERLLQMINDGKTFSVDHATRNKLITIVATGHVEKRNATWLDKLYADVSTQAAYWVTQIRGATIK